MKRLLLPFLLLCCGSLFAQSTLTVNAENDAEYTYRSTEDSLKNYFEDEFSLTFTYDYLRFGIKFNAELPEYDRYHPLQQLNSTELSTDWVERYLEYDRGGFYARGGTLETSLGSGMLFRAWEDEDFDKDTRLDGFLSRITTGDWIFTGFYGAAADQDDLEKDNLAGGLEAQYRLLHQLTLAVDGLTFQNYEGEDVDYSRQDVGGGRLSLEEGFGDFYVEYGHGKEYHKDIVRSGDALYMASNAYFGYWVVSGSYKQYNHFNYANDLNDLPIVNHCGDPLSETLEPGEDERGVMGEVRYSPDGYEFDTAYAEGWTHDWNLRQSDLYFEAKKMWEKSAVTAEFASTETIDKPNGVWDKEMTPALTFDFFVQKHPILVKLEGKYKGQQRQEKETWHYEPLLQTDIAFQKISVSMISQFYFIDSDDMFKHDPWIGVELTAQIFEHTRLVLFGGREKGGKVCRNGVCRYVTEFEGVRLNLVSQF